MHGLKDATTDQEQIERWWTQWPHANIGLATGQESGLVVIDVDPRHGGDAELIVLTQENDVLPPGPGAATGGGGWHYYFAYPNGIRVQSRNGQIAPGIDVKADGGYVVAPPSVHITGVPYEWLPGEDGLPPALPGWLLELAIAKQDRRYDVAGLPDAPSDVAPGARNSTLTTWGGRLRQYGASQSMIFASLMALNAEWSQPLDRTEVAQIAASVARYEPEAAFPVVGTSKRVRPEVYVPEPFSAASLRHEELPPMRWAVPGLIAEGLGVMAGRAKLGKSFKMLGVSVAVAEGGIALGEIPCEDGDVLYLALEDNKRRLQKRLSAMIPEGEAWPERLFIETQWPRSEQGGIDALKAFIGQHPKLRLITIDTIARFRTMPQGRGRANAYQEDYEFAAELQRLALDNAIAVVVVTHLNKTLHDDYIDKISGSVGLPGAADTIMYLDRARGTGGQKEARLRITGRDIEEQDYRVSFDGERCLWTIEGEWEGEQKSSERADLLDVMGRIGNPVTTEDIAAALGKTRPSAYKMLYRAALDGDIISHKGKLFTLRGTENPPSSPPRDAATLGTSAVSAVSPSGAESPPRTDGTQHSLSLAEPVESAVRHTQDFGQSRHTSVSDNITPPLEPVQDAKTASLQSSVRPVRVRGSSLIVEGQKDTKDTDNADNTSRSSFKIDSDGADSVPMDSRARALGSEAIATTPSPLASSPNGTGNGSAPMPEVFIPTKPCPQCGEVAWTKRASGAWVCDVCRPAVIDIKTGKGVSSA